MFTVDEFEGNIMETILVCFEDFLAIVLGVLFMDFIKITREDMKRSPKLVRSVQETRGNQFILKIDRLDSFFDCIPYRFLCSLKRFSRTDLQLQVYSLEQILLPIHTALHV